MKVEIWKMNARLGEVEGRLENVEGRIQSIDEVNAEKLKVLAKMGDKLMD